MIRSLANVAPHATSWESEVETVQKLKYGVDKLKLSMSGNVLSIDNNSYFDVQGVLYTCTATTIATLTPAAGHYYFVRSSTVAGVVTLVVYDTTTPNLYVIAYDGVRKGVYDSENEKVFARLYYEGSWSISYDVINFTVNGLTLQEGLKSVSAQQGRLNFRPIATTTNNAALAYGDDYLVMVGPSMCKYSLDGCNWTTGSISAQNWTDIIYANNIWVAVYSGGIYYSTNHGVSWSFGSATAVGNTLVKYVNGYFFVYGSQTYYYSINGMNWTSIATPTSYTNLNGFAYNPIVAKWCMTGTNTNIFSAYIYHSDTINGPWTLASTTATAVAGSIDCNGSVFFTATSRTGTGTSTYFKTSTDGINWTSSTTWPDNGGSSYTTFVGGVASNGLGEFVIDMSEYASSGYQQYSLMISYDGKSFYNTKGLLEEDGRARSSGPPAKTVKYSDGVYIVNHKGCSSLNSTNFLISSNYFINKYIGDLS